MTEKLIYGADFSGAKTVPNDTWLASGRLSFLNLEMVEVKKVGSHALSAEMIKHTPTAIGIDCPFSLPVDFLNFMARSKQKPLYQSFQEVAEELIFMPFDDFLELAKEFKREPKRFTDNFKGSLAISPLHRGNPSMIQMTYQGIRLIAALPPDRFYTVPFQSEIPDGCAVLEVYPRDVIRYFQLKETGYKSKDKASESQATSARHEIIQSIMDIKSTRALTYKDVPKLIMNKSMYTTVVNNDHALDAVLACYNTAMWQHSKEFSRDYSTKLFVDPLDLDNMDVLLEGWIYRPSPVA